ncbi:hypothetical protein LIER_18705 [Lithospermum erythrorhizon]|uniref:Uncharacterized protein n=1 Tax=Lithospermum erythrorhizon TaxID=34254 RepID=A0AAV3QJ43_LITER
MPPPPTKPSAAFSLFSGGGRRKPPNQAAAPPSPKVVVELDKEVYRPGEAISITISVKNSANTCSLLIEKLSFEIKGIEKLDSQWFNVKKLSETHSKHRRGEYLFMDGSTSYMVRNQIVSSGATRKYMVRTLLPTTLPPSYRGSTLRYFYYVSSTLSGEYINLENGHTHEESIHKLSELEVKIPLQICVTQKTNGLQSEDDQNDGIVPVTPVLLDVYWKHMDGDSEWIRINESFDGVEEGYDSSRDEVSSVSSYNLSKDDIHRSFGSSLSLQSLAARSSNKDSPHLEGGRGSTSSFRALSRLSVSEIMHDSSGGIQYPNKTSAISSSTQLLHRAKSLSSDDEARVPLVPGSLESGPSEGLARGRSYNIRLDEQVLLRFSPKNSDSTYYFSDMIGGTLTFFHEEGARRCLELSISLEMTETINRRVVHPSRRHSPTITKVHSDHQEVVADLLQTSFLFSIPMDGPMSFATRYVSVQWALRFEFFTTPKNVDWTRYCYSIIPIRGINFAQFYKYIFAKLVIS